MRTLIRWLAMALAAVPAGAEAAAPPGEGVWQGTVGTLPVRVCLRASEEGGWDRGSYYYMNKLRPLRLEAAESGTGLVERDEADKETARWSVAADESGAMRGEWRSGTRSLPVALRRVAANATSEDGPCASDAYIGPRLSPLRVMPSQAAKSRLRYTKLTYSAGPAFPGVTLESFALPETLPGDRAINAALRLDPARKDGVGDYISCVRLALAMRGTDGDYAGTIEPAGVHADFLSAAVSIGYYCGGAHPDDVQYHLTFDRRTGKAVSLTGWFLGDAVIRPKGSDVDGGTISRALRRVVLGHARFAAENAECREPVTSEEYWSLSLDRTGIGFTPQLPHVVQACAETWVVPFRELTPFLSPAGKAGAARVGGGR